MGKPGGGRSVEEVAERKGVDEEGAEVSSPIDEGLD